MEKISFNEILSMKYFSEHYDDQTQFITLLSAALLIHKLCRPVYLLKSKTRKSDVFDYHKSQKQGCHIGVIISDLFLEEGGPFR